MFLVATRRTSNHESKRKQEASLHRARLFLRQIAHFMIDIRSRHWRGSLIRFGDVERHDSNGRVISMRLLIWLSILCAILTTPALSEETAGRVALLIGNADYPDASTPLTTTVGDARTLSEEFRRLDFNVDLEVDVGKSSMRRAIEAFVAKIKPGAVALFYFGGFGLQVARQTYLIPLDARIWSEADVRREGIGVDTVLADMQRKGAKIKIVIVDGSRRNPFERRFRIAPAGLAALNAPVGTLSLLSAAPGKLVADETGPNSLLVDELLKELRVPNRRAEHVFARARIGVSRASNGKQVPWVASSLVDEFYFGQPSAAAAVAGSPPASPSSAPTPKSSGQIAARAPPGEPTPAGFRPGDVFRDCPDCPQMVVVPAGSFDMGSKSAHESPLHRVSFARPFAIGRREVTFAEWDACVGANGCKYRDDDRGRGRGERPVMNVSWLDAREYAAWLSRKTGQTYRLPSEAEWEYAARGGTTTAFWWGRDVGSGLANCRECNTGVSQQTLPAGSYGPNPFGLYDTAGNVAEWVEDCWNDSYVGAPRDGSVRVTGDCRLRALRGGAFDSQSRYLRSASRFRYDFDVRYIANGFRLVRELQP
jgi:formylglycine-generating enzyme required for sulfatase activity